MTLVGSKSMRRRTASESDELKLRHNPGRVQAHLSLCVEREALADIELAV
jgi:hypothetical protein